MPTFDEASLPIVSNEMLKASLTRTHPYTVLILRAGQDFRMPAGGPNEELTSIMWAHGRRNHALWLAGLMPVVCPVGDGSGITGVGIFAASPEAVVGIMDADPGVRAGVFTYEVHQTRAYPGSTLPGE